MLWSDYKTINTLVLVFGEISPVVTRYWGRGLLLILLLLLLLLYNLPRPERLSVTKSAKARTEQCVLIEEETKIRSKNWGSRIL